MSNDNNIKSSIRELIPAIYLAEPDRTLLKNPRAHDAVYDHDLREASLAVIGPSRAGKTRAVWNLIVAVQRNNSCRVFDAYTGDEIARAVTAQETPLIIKRSNDESIFFIDDISVPPLTARLAATFFSIIDHRTSRKLPTIITCQMTLARLEAKWKAEYRGNPEAIEAIINRIKEFFKGVSFFPQHTPPTPDAAPVEPDAPTANRGAS